MVILRWVLLRRSLAMVMPRRMLHGIPRIRIRRRFLREPRRKPLSRGIHAMEIHSCCKRQRSGPHRLVDGHELRWPLVWRLLAFRHRTEIEEAEHLMPMMVLVEVEAFRRHCRDKRRSRPSVVISPSVASSLEYLRMRMPVVEIKTAAM